ncbi:MAG: UDP-N-acetylglucosamine--N-acetylmuramyl-(pentapeptide) pyrophosphoryl-undecaprenol N-acetylglucosamine transferase, partial [Promicromonosporaceae bacterium]|nr:UDP-N-acetylglucosamine--N-acetylmuramyl-(pentapeptide) pyrophosphoryl-undecaprenol N-acetylglucosamine transferase [Promicromonosporaceae bacterium]
VSGGSSGAVSLNLAVAKAAQQLSDAGIQVLHLTGKGKLAAVTELTEGIANYHAREYLAEMQFALGAADLVITRAGAGMVSELAALGMPAIYVPLPIGNGEQRLNAEPVVRAGGGVEVTDRAFTPDWVAAEVPTLLLDPAKLAAMGEAAASVGVVDGAARIVDLIESALLESAPTKGG